MTRAVVAAALCVWSVACAGKRAPHREPTKAAPPIVAAQHHCEGSPAQCQENAAPPAPHTVVGGELYGGVLDQSLDLTPLATLLARPSEFAGKTVRTTGTIGRVCQHRGCWMELRVEQDGSVARIPMAGHAFFVPSDSSGRTATVQGAVSVTEGRDNPLRIDATAVLIASRAP